MFIKAIRSVLESEWLVPFVFLFAMAGQIFNFITYSLLAVVFVVVLILCFCKDVKNVIALILYAPFYIKNIFYYPNESLFTVAVVLAVLGLLISVGVRIFLCYKNKLFKRGDLYIALVATFVAYLLGGIFFNFSLERFVTITMLCAASMFFYFLSINSTKDLARFMYKTFVWGALMVTLEIFIWNYINGGIKEILTRYFIDVGAENVNVAALFILLGVCGAFGLGYGTKYDCVFSILAAYFVATTFVTRSRMIIFLSCVTFIVFTIICFLDSQNRKKLIIYLSGLVVVVVSLAIVNLQSFLEIFTKFSEKEGLSGRDRLWRWCIGQFLENPVFGIGFIYPEKIPGLGGEAAKYVLAHNTLVQWLCSLGLVGTLLMFFFTYKKYGIVMRNLNVEFILRFTVVVVALSGIVDQAAQMDPFILNLVIVMVAAIENLERNEEKDRYIKNYGYRRIIKEAVLTR